MDEMPQEKVQFNLDQAVALITACVATSNANQESRTRAIESVEVMAQWIASAQAELDKMRKEIRYELEKQRDAYSEAVSA